jgi:hypothetical protein
MNDLETPPVPRLPDARLLARRRHLVAELTTRRRRRQRAFALGGAGVTAAGVSTTLVMLLGGTPSAFAAWTALPTTPSPGQVAAAKLDCAARPINPPPGTPALPAEVTLTDTRGPFTLLLYGTNTTAAGALLCMSGPDGTQLSIEQGTLPALPGPGEITLNRLQGESVDGQSYTIAEGWVGPGVSATTLVLSNGAHVVTTAGNGLFLAWWPGTATVTSATLTTASGTKTQTINPPPIDTSRAAGIMGSALRTVLAGGRFGRRSLSLGAERRRPAVLPTAGGYGGRCRSPSSFRHWRFGHHPYPSRFSRRDPNGERSSARRPDRVFGHPAVLGAVPRQTTEFRQPILAFASR